MNLIAQQMKSCKDFKNHTPGQVQASWSIAIVCTIFCAFVATYAVFLCSHTHPDEPTTLLITTITTPINADDGYYNPPYTETVATYPTVYSPNPIIQSSRSQPVPVTVTGIVVVPAPVPVPVPVPVPALAPPPSTA